MNMIEDVKSEEELLENVLILCPKCKTQKNLKIPSKIINQSKHLITISIPAGITCEHSFQAYIDKNFVVRGYQSVDFELSKMEFYESSIKDLKDEQEIEADLSDLTSLPLFQEIISLLRGSVDDTQILGTALFTAEGKVLYTSLPQSTLFNTLREFEVRNEKKLISIIKMFLELENHQKVCSEYIQIHDKKFILILIFSNAVRFGMGILFLRDLVKNIKKLT